MCSASQPVSTHTNGESAHPNPNVLLPIQANIYKILSVMHTDCRFRPSEDARSSETAIFVRMNDPVVWHCCAIVAYKLVPVDWLTQGNCNCNNIRAPSSA